MPKRALTLIGLLALCCLAMNLADPYEGTRWKIKAQPDDDTRKLGEKDFDDVISFKLNKLTSEALSKQGFAPAIYDADLRARGMGAASFSAVMNSPSNGAAKWTGLTAVQSIKGQIIWTKNGKTLTFDYSGDKVIN